MRRGRLAKRPIGVVAKELLRYLQSQGMRDFYLPVDEETQLRALGALSTLRRVNDRIPIGAGKHIDGQTIILFVENLVGRAGAGQRPVGRFVQPGAKASMVNIVQQPQFRALMGELVAHLPKIERDASKALIHSDVIQGSEMLEWYGPYRADIRLRALVGRILDAAEGASPAATLRRLNKEIVEVVADVRRQPPVSSLGARVKSMGITDALSVLEAVVTPDARELEGWSRPGQSEHLSKVRDEASFVSAIHRDQGALLPLESLPRHLQAAVTSMATYEESGQQVFVVGPRLQEMFSETSLREIPSGALKTPYDSFYVALPDCDFSIWGDEATGWHRLSGFYVVDLVPSFAVMGLDAVGDEHGEKDAWLFFLWGAENSYSRGYGDDASFFFTVDKAALDKSGLDLEEWLRKKLSSKSLTHRDQTWDQITRWPGQGESPGRSASEEQKNEGQLGASIFTIRVFFNLLMYLRAADPEVVGDPDADANTKERKRLEKRIKETKNVKKRRQAKRTLTRISSAKIHYVGPSIEEAGEEEASELAKTGRRRHWVRGHWRQFRRGKWTWIQPHQRGRAGVLPRTYSLVDE
jgi:hypothetical protein